MYAAIGIVVLLVMVFGGFALTGGALGPVMAAVPLEMMIIGGAAVGAMIAGNSLHELKAIGSSFIKIFKYTGDFAKLRSKGMKAKAQEERIAHFDTDHQEYLKALQATVQQEEKAYEASSAIIFEKLCITQENFERSQQ